MLAQVLHAPAPIATEPLQLEERETPSPRAGQVLIRIEACAVCHTDLHVVEGELEPPHWPIVPGHQIVGHVAARGEGAERFVVGARVGVPWLNWIDPACRWYGTPRENLCENIRFTGLDTDGGYAEYITIGEDFAYALPEGFTAEQAAPLLCAGVIGLRALNLSNLEQGTRLGLFGFGASASLVLQIARDRGKQAFVFTRSPGHQAYARELGAEWVGAAADTPPHPLDSAIIFAPSGALLVRALALLERGGTVVHAGVHSSDIPSFPYALLYHERTMRSAANSTHADVQELLELARRIPLRASTTAYPLAEANRALADVKTSRVNGSAVLLMR